MKEVIIIRKSHRKERDYRVTTHCCLVSRAFNAKKIIIDGEKDYLLENRIKKISKKWGGSFKITFTNNWLKEIKKLRKAGFVIVHLTMYGENINTAIKKIKKSKIVVIIGSEKVEKMVYDIADYNIGIGNQPHSEIAALSVFLDRLFKGKELEKQFKNAKILIKGSIKGQKIVKKKN